MRLTTHQNVVAITLSRNCVPSSRAYGGVRQKWDELASNSIRPHRTAKTSSPSASENASSVYGQQNSSSWETKFKTWILRNFHQQLDRSTDIVTPTCEVGSEGTASNELTLTWVK